MASEIVRFKLEGDMPRERAAELMQLVKEMGVRLTFEAMSDVVSPSVAIDMIKDATSGLNVLCVTVDSVATWLMERYGYVDSVANTQAGGIFRPIYWHAVHGHERERSWSTCDCRLRSVQVRKAEWYPSYERVITPESFAEFAALGPDMIQEVGRSSGRGYGAKRVKHVQEIGERITRDLAGIATES